MLVFSITWLMLAVAVTLLAMKTRSHALKPERVDIDAKESGQGVAFLASIYGLALLGGFFYVTKFFLSSL